MNGYFIAIEQPFASIGGKCLSGYFIAIELPLLVIFVDEQDTDEVNLVANGHFPLPSFTLLFPYSHITDTHTLLPIP